jgi:exopolysaccharide biosynthesis polyprenyl glycosylphosphotransferase
MESLPVPTVPTQAAQRPALRVVHRSPKPSRDLFEGPRWRLLSLVTDANALWIAALVAIHSESDPGSAATPLLALLAVVALARLAGGGMYGARPARMSLLDTARVTAGAHTFGAMCALAVAALTHLDGASSDVVVRGWALGTACVVAGRVALAGARRQARRRGLSGKRALIVGAGFIGAQLERRLLAMPELGLRPVGFLDADPPTGGLHGRTGPVLGAPRDLAEAVALTGAEHVMVAFSSAPDSTVQPLLQAAEELGIEVSVVPRLFENVNERQWVEHVGGLPLYGLRRVDPKSWQFAAKHAIDRTVAALVIVLAAPILAVVAVAVRLSSPGPILYRQRRVGRDGHAFDILKFRSMRVATGPVGFRPPDGTAPGGVEGEDRRTPVGAFLRRTCLDELPQVFNVVKGDMSLVGPRPERPEFVEAFGRDVRRYGERHRVKSGITGWAQVHGLRGQTSLSERVEWDNWYIGNWSLWLDVKILLMTPLAILRAPSEAPTPHPGARRRARRRAAA